MDTGNRRTNRATRGLAATTIAALALTGVGSVPAAATPGPGADPLPPGVTVTVVHNKDVVMTTGWGDLEPLTIEVERDGVVIGSVTAPAGSVLGGFGLEVNRDLEGVVGPGNCWDLHTPDIRPHDTVRIRYAVPNPDPTLPPEPRASEVLVDDLRFSGHAVQQSGGDILVRGVATRGTEAGEVIAPAALDLAFFEHEGYAGAPHAVEADPAVDGGFVMRYRSPYLLESNDDGFDQVEREWALLFSRGHTVGFTDGFETQLVEGLEDVSGPTEACRGSAAARDAVTSFSDGDGRLNAAEVAAGGDLTIFGSSYQATAVSVKVGTLTTVDAAINGDVTGSQTWTASVPMADVAALPDGDIPVTMQSTRSGGTLWGVPKTLVKDVAVPVAPTATPGAGTFDGSVVVTLYAGAGDSIRYNAGDGTQAAPTARSGWGYFRPFQLTHTATVKAVAIDAAGNESPPLVRTFTRNAPPPPPVVQPPPTSGSAAVLPLAPRNVKAKPGKPGGVKTATARWRAPKANGAVLDGYRVRLWKIRPGKSAKKVKVVRVGVRKTRLKTALPRGTYKFQVRAASPAGKSPWSKRSNKARSR